jgi:hypothetical protein
MSIDDQRMVTIRASAGLYSLDRTTVLSTLANMNLKAGPGHGRSLSTSNHVRKNQGYDSENEDRAQAGNVQSD